MRLACLDACGTKVERVSLLQQRLGESMLVVLTVLQRSPCRLNAALASVLLLCG